MATTSETSTPGAILDRALNAPVTHAAVVDALVEADGCFEAALFEGWLDALAEGDIDRIRDLWTRRIGFARHALAVGMAALHDAGVKAEGRS